MEDSQGQNCNLDYKIYCRQPAGGDTNVSASHVVHLFSQFEQRFVVIRGFVTETKENLVVLIHVLSVNMEVGGAYDAVSEPNQEAGPGWSLHVSDTLTQEAGLSLKL